MMEYIEKKKWFILFPKIYILSFLNKLLINKFILSKRW